MPKQFMIDEDFVYEKMIYDLATLFHKDSIYIENNYTVIDYFTWMSFKKLENAYEKYEIDNRK